MTAEQAPEWARKLARASIQAWVVLHEAIPARLRREADREAADLLGEAIREIPADVLNYGEASEIFERSPVFAVGSRGQREKTVVRDVREDGLESNRPESTVDSGLTSDAVRAEFPERDGNNL